MSQSLTCPVCLKKISPDAAKLSQHLRLDHLVSRNAVISCSEVGCHRSFTRLDNFVRHLKNFHCGRMARSSGQLNSEPTPDGLMMPEVATEVVTTYDCTPASDLEDYTKLIAKDEEVNGFALCQLTDDEMKTIGFKSIGMRIRLKKLLAENGQLRPDLTFASNANSSFGGTSCSSEFEPEEDDASDNVKAILLSHPEGQEIINQVESDGFFQIKHQNKFIKICVDWLVKKALSTGHLKKYYPPASMKEELAKSIVASFPMLRNGGIGCLGYEQFYDPASRTGYIENRSKTMRKSLDSSEKMYKKRQRLGDAVTETGCEVTVEDTSSDWKIAWLHSAVPTQENLPIIKSYMTDSFNKRRKEISALSVSQILAKYPRFVDTGSGVLIEDEFLRLYPNAKKDVLRKFGRSLITVASKRMNYFPPQSAPAELQAVHALMKLLPAMNTSKSQHELGCIIYFGGVGADPVIHCESKKDIAAQPYLFADGTESKTNQFYLILDHNPIAVGNNVCDAVYRLFSCFWVFDLHYCHKWRPFFNFYEAVILGHKPVCSVQTLLAALAVNMGDD